MKLVQKSVAGLASFAVVGGALLLSAGAASAATPTVSPVITGDPNAQGTISFFNKAGAHIYSGPLSSGHIADYAVASSATSRVGTTKAALVFATPDHTKSDSQTYTSGGGSAASVWNPTVIPPASLGGPVPPSVTAAAGPGVPVAALAPTDGDVGGAWASTIDDPTPGFDHIVQVRLLDSGPGHSAQVAPFWQADVYIDTAAGTWTQLFPAPPTLVNTSISTPAANPASPAPSGTTSVALSATLSAADSSHPAGTVELFNGTTDVGPAALNASTGAISVNATVADSSTYAFNFVFTPSGSYNPSTSASLSYHVNGAAAVTTTTVSGPTSTTTGSAITLHADVKSSGTAVPASAGAVQFKVGGTNSGNPVPLTATGADFSYNPTGAGAAAVTATFVPADTTLYAPSSDSTGVTVTTTAPAYAPDAQTVVVTVPTGTLVISTPYTAANPFNLGTLALNANGTGLSASAPFGDPNAPATTDPGNLGTTTLTGAYPSAKTSNGVTITDTRAGSTGWTASAQTTDFAGPAGNTSPIPGDNLAFTGVTPKYITGNALQAGSVTTTDITAFKTTKKAFATTTHGPGTVDITGTLGLNAATSTTPGLYTATITFTIA